MTGKTILHYKILERIGAGAMGVVYKARDIKLDRLVALKFLPVHLGESEEEKKRFIQEAKTASYLDHKNICTIYEINEVEDGQIFIAMTYYDGESLKKKIEREPLKIEKAVSIAIQVSEGLAKAHKQGIVHRDIKPANIMITNDGVAKIVDFGLAKLLGGTKLSKSGSTMGTAAYMSPEQTHGEEVDHRTDIWSLGVVLYEMLTGQLPFKGGHELAVMYSIIKKEPEPITSLRTEVPTDLRLIVDKALAKSQQERYQHANELLADLQAFNKRFETGTVVNPSASYHLSSMAKTGSTSPSSPITSLKHRYKIAGLITLLIMLLSVSIWVLTSNQTVRHWLGLMSVRHIVVLPFTYIGDDPLTKALSNGLVETLTNKLSQMEQFEEKLWVVPASEVRKNNVSSASEALQLFGINLVITGSVEDFRTLLRVTINLVDAKTQKVLDFKAIDVLITNVSALQEETVNRVMEMLNVQVRPKEHRILMAGATAVSDAYEFYLQGRGTLQGYEREENIDAAIDLFQRSIQADSQFALAYLALGEAYLRKYQLSKEAQWAEQVAKNCQFAVELDEFLVPAHVTLGLIYSEQSLNQQALFEFQKALELDPVNADAYRGLAKVQIVLGQVEEAELTYKTAISMKPDYWGRYNALGVFYYRYGRYEDAAAQFRQVIELNPLNAKGYDNLGSMYFYLNRRNEAIFNFEQALKVDPDYTSVYSNLATLYFYDGQYRAAAKMYEKVLERSESNNQYNYQYWGWLAESRRWSSGEKNRIREAYQQAITLTKKKLQVNPGDKNLLTSLAGYYEGIGENEKALSLLEQVGAMDPKEVDILFSIGQNYELLGERELALLWIEKALAQGYPTEQLEISPGLENLRRDRRFKQILQKQKDKKHKSGTM